MCSASNLSATDYDFVEDLPPELTCNICMNVLNSPQIINCCGQCFCQSCLDKWFQRKRAQECPHCRNQNIERMRWQQANRKIAELKVYCSNKTKGCKVVLKLCQLENHLADLENGCGYIDIPCPNKCGKSFFRKDIQQHTQNKCPKREVTCKYCNLQGMDELINGQHLKECQEFPVPCPRKCKAMVLRKEIDNHRRKCPLEPVDCPFYDVGCQEKLVLKDLGDHLQTNTSEHLLKLMTAHTKLKVEHGALLDKHSTLLDKHNALLVQHSFKEPLYIEQGKMYRISIPDPCMYKGMASKAIWRSQPIIMQNVKFCLRQSFENVNPNDYYVEFCIMKQDQFNAEIDVYLCDDSDETTNHQTLCDNIIIESEVPYCHKNEVRVCSEGRQVLIKNAIALKVTLPENYAMVGEEMLSFVRVAPHCSDSRFVVVHWHPHDKLTCGFFHMYTPKEAEKPFTSRITMETDLQQHQDWEDLNKRMMESSSALEAKLAESQAKFEEKLELSRNVLQREAEEAFTSRITTELEIQKQLDGSKLRLQENTPGYVADLANAMHLF